MLRVWAGKVAHNILNIPVSLIVSNLPLKLHLKGISLHAFAFPFACYLVLTSLGVGTGGFLVILAQPVLGKPCILRPGE